MQAEPSATSAPKYVVEVSDFSRPMVREDLTSCRSLEGLASALDEGLGIGKEACQELAEQVAAGEDFSEENPETGEEVTAWVEAALVGGRA